MDTVRWGIIGCGDVTEIKSGPGFQKADGSALVAVMRRDRAKAEDYARRHGVPRVHRTADANSSTIPASTRSTSPRRPSSHCELALQVAAAGKPCLVEKPMARDARRVRAHVEAFRQAGQPLWVAYYRRALPRFLKVRGASARAARSDASRRSTSTCASRWRRQIGRRAGASIRRSPAPVCSSISVRIASICSISSSDR